MKTTAAITVTIAACLAAFGILTVNLAEDAVTGAEVDRLDGLADARAAQVAALATGFERQADQVASVLPLRELLAEHNRRSDPAVAREITEVIQAADTASERILSISVIDAGGMIVASTDRALAGTVASATPASFGTVPPPGDPTEVQAIVGSASVDFAAFSPLRLDGEALGTVQLRLASTDFDQLVQTAGFDRTGEIVIGLTDSAGNHRLLTLDPDGTTPAITELADVRNRDIPMVRAFEGELAVLTDGVYDYDAVPVIAVTRHLPDFDWGLVAKIDEDEVLSRIGNIRTVIVGFGAVLLLAGVVASFVIGRRLQAELGARTRAERRFASLFDSSPAATLLVGLDGEVRLANYKAAELLGYDRDRLQRMPVEELVPPQQRAEHARLRNGLVGKWKGRVMRPGRDVIALAADGRELPVEISLTQVETDRGPAVLAAMTDLTERKEAELALAERAEALARSNRDLDSFAYVASHDLKAPLRAIEQLAGFVLEDAEEGLPGQCRADLEQIQQRSARLMLLLNGLLQYSRIGRQEGGPTVVSTRQLLFDLAELYLPSDRFELDVPEHLPSIWAPPPAVELVFRNLLMNSVKHHDRDHGRISVECRTEDRYVCFTVADDGPGIPEKDRTKVFELFQTLKATGGEDATGMGLALVKRTIETQGGRIDVGAGEGRGASFDVRWPRHIVNEARDRPPVDDRNERAEEEAPCMTPAI